MSTTETRVLCGCTWVTDLDTEITVLTRCAYHQKYDLHPGAK